VGNHGRDGQVCAGAIRVLDDGEPELAAAMYRRLRTRWQALEALELAN
jgi:hypothetical protein